MLAIGPNMAPSHGQMRIEAPSFGDDVSDDEASDDQAEKPLGIEEFKQRVENTRKQEAKGKKGQVGGLGGMMGMSKSKKK